MLERLSACPRCTQQPTAGERYCGVCGADLTAGGSVPSPSPDSAVGPVGEPDFTIAPAEGARPGQGPGYSVQGPPVQGPPVVPPVQQGPAVPDTPQGPPVRPPQPAPPLPASATHEQPPHGAADGAGMPGATNGAGMPDPAGGAVPPHPQGAPPPPTSPPSVPPPGPPPGLSTPDPRAADPRVALDDSPVETARCVACGTGAVDGDGYCDHCGHKQPRERDHMESALPSVAAASDRGLRHHRNEDYFSLYEAVTPSGAPATIAVVCDGVSSATRPDDASTAAARAAGASMRDAVPQGAPAQQAMHNALIAASDAVTALAAEGPNEPSKNAPACTIVGALTAEGILTVGWIGDSRAYWVPDEQGAPPARLTEDDSWAAQMVAAGLMTEDEAYTDARAHAITGWLGADAYEIEPHTASYKPEGPGVVIVCTDGLWNYAESAEQMAAAVPGDGRLRPLHAAQRLVGFALDGGGHDNATVAVIPFPSPSEGPGGA